MTTSLFDEIVMRYAMPYVAKASLIVLTRNGVLFCVVAFLAGLLWLIAPAHGLAPPPAMPQWLPGQDVVAVSRYGDNDAETLEGTHCTVTDMAIDRHTKTYWYEVNAQGWGDFRRYRAETLATRKEFEAMQREFLRERNWPSWWMPLYKDGDE